jgi:hypothetical protein
MDNVREFQHDKKAAETPKSSGRMIDVVEADEIIPWQAQDPDTKELYESRFQLRQLPKALREKYRKTCTRQEFTRRGREEVFDSSRYVDLCLDYAIVGWSGVNARIKDAVTGEMQRFPLECTQENKPKLPEFIKAEIVRMCVGQELGSILAGETEDEAEAAAKNR